MVLMQLDGPLSLLRLRRCCRRMKEAADSEAVWERLCWTTYKVTRSSFLVGTWHEVFVEHTRRLEERARSEAEREERYLDRRSAVGLARLCRGSVEGTLDLS